MQNYSNRPNWATDICIKMLRLEMSQKQLASALKINPARLNGILNGKIISNEQQQKIINYFSDLKTE